MKFLKIFLIVLIAVIAVLLIAAAFLPSDYRVERAVVIAQPADSIYAVLIDFSQRKVWDPWMQMEPEARLTISDPPQGIGASWQWEGEVIGSGSMTLLSGDPGKSIRSKLEFTAPRQTRSEVTWALHPVEGGTRVVWGFEGDLAYPVERFFGLMFDSMIGPDFERGLKNLKEYLE